MEEKTPTACRRIPLHSQAQKLGTVGSLGLFGAEYSPNQTQGGGFWPRFLQPSHPRELRAPLCPTPASPFWEKSLELPQTPQDSEGFEASLQPGLSFSPQGVLERWEIDAFDLSEKVENEDIFWGVFSWPEVCPMEQQGSALGSRNALIPLKPARFFHGFHWRPSDLWEWARC